MYVYDWFVAYKYYVTKVEALSCFWPYANLTPLREVETLTRFERYETWHLNELLRPFSFNIWDLIGYLRPFSAFDTFLTDIWDRIRYLRPFSAFDTLFNIWDLIRYLRPFSAFETLFIQHLRPYWLFETLFSIWHPFGGLGRSYYSTLEQN